MRISYSPLRFRPGLAGPVAVSSFIRLVHFIAQTGAVVVLARFLSPQSYGIYSYWLALIVLLTTPLRLGGAQVLTRYTAGYSSEASHGLLRGLWRRHLEWVVLFAVVMALLIGLAIRWRGLPVLDGDVGVAYVSLGLLLLMPLADAFGGAIRGLDRPLLGQMPEYIIRPVVFVLLLAIYVGIGKTLTPSIAMGTHVLAALASAAAAMVMIAMLWPRTGVSADYRDSEWLGSLIPLSFAAGMFVINAQADVVLLGWLSTPEDVGVYRIYGQGAMSVMLPSTAFALVSAPTIARYYSQGRKKELQKLIRWQARGVFYCVLFLSVVAFVFGDEIVRTLVGEAYVKQYAVFVVLLLSQIFSAAMGPVGIVLSMCGHEKATLAGVAWGSVVNVLMNIILIPRFGMMGAGLATLLSVAIWSILLSRAVVRTVGIQPAVIGRTYR